MSELTKGAKEGQTDWRPTRNLAGLLLAHKGGTHERWTAMAILPARMRH